jgi:tRNA modification GTPase
VFRARLLHPGSREPVDDCLAACFPAPRSYTGDDLVEISTHGGLVVPAAALAAFVAAGARLAEPGEFTRRAVLNGKMDLLQAEATADLIDAGSPVQRRRALQQLERGLSDRLGALRGEILELEALIAYDIDFPEEDEGPVSETTVRRAWCVVRDRVADLLKTAPEGERLREGALLVIAGRPNAGKSSLFNALLGTERAIVTEIPGTTRDAIEAHAVIEGFPFRLVDTAGLRASTERIERLGIEVSKKYLAAADLVLYCEEGDDPGRDEFLTQVRVPVVVVRTKADVTGAGVSVITGQGVPELRRRRTRRHTRAPSHGVGARPCRAGGVLVGAHGRRGCRGDGDSSPCRGAGARRLDRRGYARGCARPRVRGLLRGEVSLVEGFTVAR